MNKRKFFQIVSAVCAIVSMIAYQIDDQDETISVTANVENTRNVEIVLMNQMGFNVPFSVEVSQGLEWVDLLNQMVAQMSDASQNEGYQGIFPSGTKILSAYADAEVLYVNFNDALLYVNPANELQLVETIRYVFTQFEGINKVEVKVNNELLEQIKFGNMKLEQPLSRSQVLNPFITYEALFHRSNQFVAGITYQDVHTTQLVRTDLSVEEAIELHYTSPSSIFVSEHNLFEKLDIVIEDSVVVVHVSDEILSSQNIVDEDKLASLILCLRSNYQVDLFMFYVDGVQVYEINPEDFVINKL